MEKNNSCLNCKERQISCHTNCNKYKEYKAYLDIIKNNKKKENLYRRGLKLWIIEKNRV